MEAIVYINIRVKLKFFNYTLLYKYVSIRVIFGDVFIFMFILFYLAIVGYEMIITNSALGATYLVGFLPSHIISNTRLRNKQ